MILDPPIVVCKPRPAGSAAVEEFYYYSGSINSMLKVPEGRLDFYEAVDDAPVPNVYRLPRQNGWVLDFLDICLSAKRWVVFSHKENLWLDDGVEIVCLDDDSLVINVGCVAGVVRIEISSNSANYKKIVWSWFPCHRLIFWDPVVDLVECHPLLDIFSQLRSEDGRALWRNRWSSGVAHRSSGLFLVEKREAAPVAGKIGS